MNFDDPSITGVDLNNVKIVETSDAEHFLNTIQRLGEESILYVWHGSRMRHFDVFLGIKTHPSINNVIFVINSEFVQAVVKKIGNIKVWTFAESGFPIYADCFTDITFEIDGSENPNVVCLGYYLDRDERDQIQQNNVYGKLSSCFPSENTLKCYPYLEPIKTTRGLWLISQGVIRFLSF